MELSTSLDLAWLRRSPTMTVKPVSTSARDLGEGRLKLDRTVLLMGTTIDFGLVLDDRLRIPLLGGGLYWAFPSYDTQITSYEGSIARVRPWTLGRAELLLPGIGQRWKYRRNMFAATVRTGVIGTTVEGTIVSGRETDALDMHAVSFLVQAELEGCRRLDPTTRVCLQVVPRVYDHELLNGVIFGVRMEWGQ